LIGFAYQTIEEVLERKIVLSERDLFIEKSLDHFIIFVYNELYFSNEFAKKRRFSDKNQNFKKFTVYSEKPSVN
jgi:hypothetical protein